MEKTSLQYQDLITKESEISIRRQCDLLSINRSSIYYVPVEADKERLLLQEKLMERIDYWHTTMPYLGSRKITKLLVHEGFKVCRKTVRILLERMSITAIYPKENLSKRNFKEAVVPYLLRNYKVTAANQVWSIDITYIKMHHGHMYLTAYRLVQPQNSGLEFVRHTWNGICTRGCKRCCSHIWYLRNT